MRQKDLTVTINLQNHRVKIKTTWNITRVETGKRGKNKENIKPGKINPLAPNDIYIYIYMCVCVYIYIFVPHS